MQLEACPTFVQGSPMSHGVGAGVGLGLKLGVGVGCVGVGVMPGLL